MFFLSSVAKKILYDFQLDFPKNISLYCESASINPETSSYTQKVYGHKKSCHVTCSSVRALPSKLTLGETWQLGNICSSWYALVPCLQPP